jgi:hypothetical protein
VLKKLSAALFHVFNSPHIRGFIIFIT